MKKILCYDLSGINSSDIYSQIRKDIESIYPKSVYILNTTYLFYTGDSMDTVHSKIKNILSRNAGESNFEFFTAKFTEQTGWLQKNKWTEISEKLGSSIYN